MITPSPTANAQDVNDTGEVFALNAREDQPFMDAWCEMEAKGFAYGDEELESVHLGWLMARGHLVAAPATEVQS